MAGLGEKEMGKVLEVRGGARGQPGLDAGDRHPLRGPREPARCGLEREGEEDIQRRGRTGNPRNRVAQGPGAASGTGGEGV